MRLMWITYLHKLNFKYVENLLGVNRCLDHVYERLRVDGRSYPVGSHKIELKKNQHTLTKYYKILLAPYVSKLLSEDKNYKV